MSKIAPPNALETYVGGINNNGIVVGYSDIDNVGVKAFVLSKKAIQFSSIPNSLEFWASKI
jgi:probable HAF family extracellular repeat protein